MPEPSSWSDHYHLEHDAWNRLVRVFDADGTSKIAEYQYDGQNRRTIQKTYSGGQLAETRHYYYSREWQVLEERAGGAPLRCGWGENLTVRTCVGSVCASGGAVAPQRTEP